MLEIDTWLAQHGASILQSLNEGIVIEDAEGRFAFVNAAITTLLGYTADELIGQHWTMIVPPDQQPLVYAALERRRRGKTDRYEVELLHRDGTRVPILVSAAPRYEHGQWVGAYAVFTNITAQKRAEELLRASEERYRYATQATGQLIYDYAIASGQIQWAGAIQDVTGFTPEEFAHVDIRAWEALIHPDDRDEAVRQLERAHHEQRAYHVEYRFRRKDGAYIWIEDYGRFLQNVAGQTCQMIGAMRDITERKRAEAALCSREAILAAVAFATETLFRSSDWTENIQVILARLGQAVGASRAYIFENYTDRTGALCTTQRYEWVAPGIVPQMDNPALQAVPYEATAFTRWVHTMSQRQAIYGLVRDFPPGEREFLAAQDILSIIAMPIYTGAQWWGFIGFDECQRERIWSEAEIDALRIAADNLGSAIARLQMEQALRLSEDRYRDLVEHSPAIIVLHDWEGRILDINPTAVHMLGYAHDELWHLRIPDVLSPEVRHHFDDYIATLQKNGRASGLMRVQTRDGEIRILEYASTLRTQGVATPVVRVMARDVTDLRRAQRQLRQRANEFAALYQVAQELTTLTDLQTLLQTIVTHAVTLLQAQGAAIFLYDETLHELELTVVHNFPLSPPLRLKLGEGGAGRVAQTRQSLMVDDYSTWEQSPPTTHASLRAALYVPVLFGGELIGVLNVVETGDSTRKFTENDARLLTLFAAQAAAAVHNARLFHQTQQRAQQLALLYDAALALNRALESRPVIQHLLQIVSQSVRSNRTEFYRYDPASRTLTFDSSGGDEDHIVSRLCDLIFIEGETRGLVGQVAAERTPLYLPDVSADARWIPLDPTIRSAFWVPVEHEQNLYGVLVVTSTRHDAFSSADQRLVTLFANQVAVALTRAALFHAEQTRRAEISASYELARQLADAETLEAVCKVVVQHCLAILPITSARLALVEDDTLILCAPQPTTATEPVRLLLASLPQCQALLKQHEPLILHANMPHLSAFERAWLDLDSVTLCGLPLYAEGRALGLLLLGAPASAASPFTAEGLQHVRSIGNQAASAIRRAKLREQTEQRLRQVQALHTIDMTISASLDVNTTLQILLPILMAQLQADAVALLHFNPATHLLTYMAGRGFRSHAIEQSILGVGKEYAGRAVLERRTMSEPNLAACLSNLQRRFLVTDEQFVSYVCTPLVAKGQVKGVLEIFFRTPFTPTAEWRQILDAFSVQAALAVDNAELFRHLQRANTELLFSYEALIDGWAHTIEAREQVGVGHNRRVADWASRVARALGIVAPQLQQIRYGALLHNLEYVFLPDDFPRRCTERKPEDQALARQQIQKVYELLSSRPLLRPLLDIPYGYHEHWDGSGYPRGLRGEQIPLGARIVAVADTWEHHLSESDQAPATARQRAAEYLLAHSGTRFDPQIVRVFLELQEISQEEKA